MKTGCFFGVITVFFALLELGLRIAPVHAAVPDGRTFNGVYYPTDTLGYALETNYAAITNRLVRYNRANDTLLIGPNVNPANPTGLSWNTNSILTGKRGVTAISIAQFGGTQNRLCLITKRHAVGAGHYGGVTNGLTVWFLGTNNLLHRMTTSNTWIEPIGPMGEWVAGYENREIVTFTEDVPADVEPMKLAGPLISKQAGAGRLVEHLLPWMTGNHSPAVLFVCQHGYCGRLLQGHPGGAIGMDGGDSGSPGFLLLGDQCVNIGGVSMGYPTTNMLRRMDVLSRSLGLNPENYQPSFVGLTNYPTWPY